MKKRGIPKAILEKIKLITGKRSRIVVDHIVKHDSITTEDLERYGYKHPPRAVRDVREQGLPLEMFWTKNSTGRKIAGYRFGNPNDIQHNRVGGRKTFSKAFHFEIYHTHHGRCAICGAAFEPRYLQLDHKIPYQVTGDSGAPPDANEFMPVCGSCNRAKSWSCEHCLNWQVKKNPKTCATCYWASPEDYRHVAMREMRRLNLVWEGKEVMDFDQIAANAEATEQTIPKFVKDILRRRLK